MNRPTPNLLITPARAAMAARAAGQLEFVVRLQTPALPEKQVTPRPTLNLALAIDASGSMVGRPLQEAHRAVLSIVDRLADTDRVAVVVYDTSVEIVLESMTVAQARPLLAARLAVAHSGGGTDLHAGWLRAAEQAAPFVSQYGMTRVILLSDGNANAGMVDVNAIAGEAARLAAAGVGTSTYGLGVQFNELLMTKMAVDGQACYAETADQLCPYFDNEFKLLASTIGRRVALGLTVRTSSGTALAVDNLNDFARSDAGWGLPNLLAGGETWAAFSVDVPALEIGVDVVVDASVSWMDIEGKRHNRTLAAAVPVRAKTTKKEDAWAVERIREARAARLQREMVAKAQRGDMAGVHVALRSMTAMSVGNAYMGGVSQTLGGHLASGNLNAFVKEAVYAANAMSTRVATTNEDAAVLSKDTFGMRKVAQGKAQATGEVAASTGTAGA